MGQEEIYEMDLKKFSSVVADNLKDVGITEQMVDTAVNSTLNLVSNGNRFLLKHLQHCYQARFLKLQLIWDDML